MRPCAAWCVFKKNFDTVKLLYRNTVCCRHQLQEFKHGLGPKLQRLLVLKSFWAQNWVSDWWWVKARL